MGELSQRTQETRLVQARPQDRLKQLLERSWPRIAAVMPRELNPERLYQMYVSTINREPMLAECSVESVLSCFMQCTALGLEPSNVNGLGMAYLLPYGNKNRQGQKQAQLIVGYKGMIELARRSGQIKSIHAQAVYEGDDFDCWEDESGQHFRFHQARGAEHSEKTLTDVFVNAQLMNGGFVFEHMTRAEVDRIRSRSKASGSGPWVSDYEAMAKKTVIRRVFPSLPVSTEARTAAVADETTPDYSDVFKPVIEDVETQQIEQTQHPSPDEEAPHE